MLETALKFISEINSHGYKAYIVGGFVRDYILGIESHDIDIATNATPKEVKEIFDNSCLPAEDYGSVTVIKLGVRFEVTTFRKDISYVNNRYLVYKTAADCYTQELIDYDEKNPKPRLSVITKKRLKEIFKFSTELEYKI